MLMQFESPRRPTNLSAKVDLLARAKSLDINLSATFERALELEVKARERALWIEENQEAIQVYNERVNASGVWSDGLRSF